MSDLYVRFRSALPPTYVEFIESHDGWEGDPEIGDGYVVIWNRESIQEMYDGYEMDSYLNERWFPFGSNGGGEMLCFDLASGSDRIFMLPFIGMSDETPIPRLNSFADLAARILSVS